MRASRPIRAVLAGLFGSVLLLSAAACASGRSSRSAETRSGLIRVVNSTVNDVDISIVRDETAVWLGRIDSQGVRVFAARSAIIADASLLSLRAETTITRERLASSPQFTLKSGQSVEWTLVSAREGVVAASTIFIR